MTSVLAGAARNTKNAVELSSKTSIPGQTKIFRSAKNTAIFVIPACRESFLYHTKKDAGQAGMTDQDNP